MAMIISMAAWLEAKAAALKAEAVTLRAELERLQEELRGEAAEDEPAPCLYVVR